MQVIEPNWSAPKRVRAASTTRIGGVSKAPFGSLNLGLHVGDEQQDVLRNRSQLADFIELPTQPMWLHQTHSTIVAEPSNYDPNAPADASYSDEAGQVCVIMTADCLPLLLCNRQGTEVAAVHAGWRGLADGIIEQTVDRFNSPADQILAWIGPCIGVNAFEVGVEVKQQLQGPESAYQAHSDPQKVYANLPELAKSRLANLGIDACFGGEHCTYSEADKFYSYRRDGVTGRMATLIWISD